MKTWEKIDVLAISVSILIVIPFLIQSNICVKANPETWTVDDDKTADFHTIQEAINSANAGDTIRVLEGTYNEHIVVNKSISLTGENETSTIIDGGGEPGDVVQITGNHVYMSNFRVQNGALYDSAIAAGPSSDIHIVNNTITRCDYGIVVFDSSYNIISGNRVYSNSWDGITLRSSSDSIVSENNASSNVNSGITILECSGNEVSDNTVSENAFGIYLYSSNHNVIFGNDFIDNGEQVGTESSTNQWYEDCLGGNYWNNYTGRDLNQDGIGDTPYLIDSNNTDGLPLMGRFHRYHASLEDDVSIVSNSTIDSFEYREPNTIKLQVSNATANQTTGFCRIAIPYTLINPSNGTVQVIIDNGEIQPLYLNTSLYDDGTSRWLYFIYPHSTHEILIVSEHSSILIILSIITAAVLAKIFREKTRVTKDTRSLH